MNLSNRFLKIQDINSTKTKKQHITHAYVHWLADPDKSGQAVQFGGFAPALAALICNSPCPSADGQRMLPPSADGQIPIASVVSSYSKKNNCYTKSELNATIILLLTSI